VLYGQYKKASIGGLWEGREVETFSTFTTKRETVWR
jgi:hypothetical protein